MTQVGTFIGFVVPAALHAPKSADRHVKITPTRKDIVTITGYINQNNSGIQLDVFFCHHPHLGQHIHGLDLRERSMGPPRPEVLALPDQRHRSSQSFARLISVWDLHPHLDTRL
jgi:hypothetical protein